MNFILSQDFWQCLGRKAGRLVSAVQFGAEPENCKLLFYLEIKLNYQKNYFP